MFDIIRLIFLSAMIFNIGMTAYNYSNRRKLSKSLRYSTFSEANYASDNSNEYEDEEEEEEEEEDDDTAPYVTRDMKLLPPLKEEVVVNDNGGEGQNNLVVDNKAVVELGRVAAPEKVAKEVKANLRKSIIKKSDSSSAPPLPSDQLVLNSGFEKKLSPHWKAKFKTMSIRLDKKEKHSGKSSVLVQERKAPAHGIVQDLLLPSKGLLKKKRVVLTVGTYRISCWAKLKNSSKDTIQMMIKYVDDTGPHNTNPVTRHTVNDKEWTLVQGVVHIKATGKLSAAKLFIEGPKAGVDFYVDDVSMKLVEDGARAAIGGSGSKESTKAGRKLPVKKDAKALPRKKR